MRQQKVALGVVLLLVTSAGAGWVWHALNRPETGGSGGPLSTRGDRPAAVRPPGPAVIEVRVERAETAVGGAALRLFLESGGEWAEVATAETDASGRATLPAYPGAQVVAARSGPDQQLRWLAAPVSLTLSLESRGALEGQVVERGSQRPISEARLFLEPYLGPAGEERALGLPRDAGWNWSCDAEGRFKIPLLPLGRFEVTAEAPGFRKGTVESVEVGRQGPLEIRLAASAYLAGEVVDADSRPVGGVEVSASGKDDSETRSDPDGQFLLEVSPGKLTLSARRGPLIARHRFELFLKAGETLSGLRLRLEPGGRVQGRVTSSGGAKEPLPASKVTLRCSTVEAAPALVGPDGRFLFEGVVPGTCTLEASAEHHQSATASGLGLLAGETVERDLELHRNARLRGTVRGKLSGPVSGARVRLLQLKWGAPGPVGEATTQEDGSYLLEEIPPGKLRLVVGGAMQTGSRDLDLKPGEDRVVDLELDLGGVLEGRVRQAAGAVLGRPSEIILYGKARWVVGDSGRVQSDGSYRVVAPAGPYRVVLRGGQETTTFHGEVELKAGETTHHDITLSGDEGPDEVLVAGTVEDPSGVPAGRTEVAVRDASGSWVGQGQTDDEGRFRIERQAAPLAGFLVVRAGVGSASGPHGTVDRVQPGDEHVRIRMLGGGRVTGAVVSQRPVKGFKLIFAAAGARAGQADFGGSNFELLEVASGPVRLMVMTTDGRVGSTEVVARSGETVDARVRLEDPAVVRGRVLDTDGAKPLANLDVSLETATGLAASEAATSEDGVFELKPVAADSYQLKISEFERGELRLPITVRSGQRLELGDLVLGPWKAPPGKIGVAFEQEPEGVRVKTVAPGSAAALAGLREGDLLVSIDGLRVSSVEEAFARVPGNPGTPVLLGVKRDGVEIYVRASRSP